MEAQESNDVLAYKVTYELLHKLEEQNIFLWNQLKFDNSYVFNLLASRILEGILNDLNLKLILKDQ